MNRDRNNSTQNPVASNNSNNLSAQLARFMENNEYLGAAALELAGLVDKMVDKLFGRTMEAEKASADTDGTSVPSQTNIDRELGEYSKINSHLGEAITRLREIVD